MNKRGQFFLIAAIIIIGVVFGLARATNSVVVSDEKKAFYSLAGEVNFETKRVLDYGVYNNQELEGLIQSYLQNYTNYIAEEEVLFIYGDTNGIRGLVFENIGGSIGIKTGTIPGEIEISYLTGQRANVERIREEITVKINTNEYKFKLKEGENFFFVIIKDEDDGRFVVAR